MKDPGIAASVCIVPGAGLPPSTSSTTLDESGVSGAARRG